MWVRGASQLSQLRSHREAVVEEWVVPIAEIREAVAMRVSRGLGERSMSGFCGVEQFPSGQMRRKKKRMV